MEQHKPGEFDMASLIKKSQEMNAEKEAKRQRLKGQQTSQSTHQENLRLVDDIKSAKTGDYVQTQDGIGGIVIDHDEELEKLKKKDKIGKALTNLSDTSKLIIDANQYDPREDGVAEGVDPGILWLKENADHPDARKIKEIKKGFAELTYGLNGLVDKNSEEARLVAEALHKLRTGEVVLPTPEEYEMQKQAAEERRRAKLQQMAMSKKQQQTRQVTSQQRNQTVRQEVKNPTVRKQVSQIKEEPKMSGLPSNVVIKKGALEEWLT